MDPLLILAIGMAVVIGGVLALRLHPFLALMLGALIVSALTSSDQLYRRQLVNAGWQIVDVGYEWDIRLARGKQVPESQPARYAAFGKSEVDGQATKLGLVDLLPGMDGRFRWKPVQSDVPVELGEVDLLVEVRDEQAAAAVRRSNWAQRIATGFGSTCGKIGIVIALAAVIGSCLLESGAATRIVVAMRETLGQKRTPLALVLSGFVIGIPVYFDTVFYLLLPLARALGRQTGRNYLLYIMSIIVGATMAHSLVPPTPGPLLVASELGVPIGQMILAGTFVGLVAATSGFAFAVWVDRRMEIDVPGSAVAHDSAVATSRESASVFETDTVQSGPTLIAALTPIVLPVILLALGTFLRIDSDVTPEHEWHHRLLLLTDKHLALGMAAVAALAMLVRHPPKDRPWSEAIQETMLSAGNIVLITAAGGAFGHVLRQSGIAEAIQERFPITQASMGLLFVAFGVTAIVRVAQGSATVAMITAVGIVAPLVAAIELPFPVVFVALAIGCGSKPLPWMNDSGFWVITRMSGMTESQSLRTFSVALTIMGLVGFMATLAGAALWSM